MPTKKPQVTVQAETLVYIYIEGESRGGFPKLPDDGGLVGGMLGAMTAGGLPLPAVSLSSGGGHYRALFRPDDAEKILAWLEREGVEREPQ